MVTTSYPRERKDPAGNFVAAHVDWLLARGHRVDVICAGDPEKTHQPWQTGASIMTVPGDGLFYRGGAPDALEGMRPDRVIRAAARFSAAARSRHVAVLPTGQIVVSEAITFP